MSRSRFTSSVPISLSVPVRSGAASLPIVRPRALRSPLTLRALHEQPMLQIDTKSSDLSRRFYLNKVLEQWASRPATLTTLRQLIFFGRTLLARRDEGKLLASANYVREELPVRIAHRIRDLQGLPYAVMTNPHMESVYAKYYMAFDRLRKFPRVRTMEDNEKFCTLLRSLLKDHLTVIPSLTIGIVESSDHLSAAQLDAFMQRMLRSRISRRVLAEQHIALSDALDEPTHISAGHDSHGEASLHSEARTPPSLSSGDEAGFQIGIIYTRLSITAVIYKVIDLLRDVFAAEKGLNRGDPFIPHVTVDGDLGARIAYVPEHLEWILFQLISNAMRSTMERPIEKRDPVPIRVTVVEGPADEDIIIRFSDSGGGLPHVSKDLASGRGLPLSEPSPNELEAMDAAAEGGLVFHDPEVRRKAHLASSRHPLRAGALDEAPQGAVRPPINSKPKDQPSEHAHASHSRGKHLHSHPSVGNGHLPAPDFAFGDDGSPLLTHNRTPFISSSAAGYTSYLSMEDAEERDALNRYLCSFSNVRKRLQLEAERKQAGQTEGHDPAVGSPPQSGLGSQQQLDTLKSTGVFRGSVMEQLREHPAGEPASSIPSYTPGAGTGTMRTMRETGLGLPMTKVYCDFFGGSIAFRSLEGHSTDVYVRLPKLGTKKERIEEIVL